MYALQTWIVANHSKHHFNHSESPEELSKIEVLRALFEQFLTPFESCSVYDLDCSMMHY